jgi:hypothetical protein
MSDDTNAGLDPRFDPAFQRGFDPSIPIEESTPDPAGTLAPVVAAPAPSIDAETGGDTAVDPEPDASLSRNPFLLFLGIISIALIAVGIWLFVRSGGAFNSKGVRTQGDYLSLDATIHAAPFIAMLGVATAIGILFVFAVRWQRRR